VVNARSVVVPGLAVLLMAMGGCWVPRGPIDLRDAETHVVKFGVEAARGGICPGEPVNLDVELTAEVGSRTMRLTRQRRDLDDAIFDMKQVRFASAQGRIDEEGRFFPNADPLVSAQSGFVFYVAVPRGPTFSVRYPPVYECATPFGREGQSGVDGPRGEDALFEDRTDLSAAFAADGELPSATGFNGGDGGPGGPGPELTIYVTWVQTPDYTKLLAARAEGDVHGLTLRAPGTPLDVLARGGRGGAGGSGGQGASGLDEIRNGKRGRHVVKTFTRGGLGGSGGGGGDGGAGGSVRVVVDERFELESWVHVDVQGGEGGPGGRAGAGGRGGAANLAGARETSASSGLPGTTGKSGPSGPNGHVSFERGDVRSHFEGLGAVVEL
jgi:hypothetical protein